MSNAQQDIEVVEVVVRYNYRNELHQLTFMPGLDSPCAIYFNDGEMNLALGAIGENNRVALPADGEWGDDAPRSLRHEVVGPRRPVDRVAAWSKVCWHDCMTCWWYCMV